MVTGIWTPRGWSLSIWASGEPASPSSLHAGSPTQQCLMEAGTVRRPTAPGPYASGPSITVRLCFVSLTLEVEMRTVLKVVWCGHIACGNT